MSRRFYVRIKTPKGEYGWMFFAWVSNNPGEWRMNDNFYIEKFGRLPDGQHAEFLVESADILHHEFAKSNPPLLHIRSSDKGDTPCIYWPTMLTEFPLSSHILSAWCVGTAYTMDTGINFSVLLANQKIPQGDFVAFIAYMKKAHSIVITEMMDGD